MTGADELVEVFRRAAAAVHGAVGAIHGPARRGRTGQPGQYDLDVVADAAALAVLRELPATIVSEESGVTRPGSDLTVVVDPVDGSTNASRGLSYWATSICAVDADGLLVALVVNQATGEENVALRGGGAWRDGRRLTPSTVERPQDGVIHVSGRPPAALRWKQYRVLGCAALALCDVAGGGLDATVDVQPYLAPWDYLGGMLVCAEAGAVIADCGGADLVTTDPTARRQVIAAGTPALLEALRSVVAP
jgi:myo-inositol-1(or 4)-monophosphatase